MKEKAIFGFGFVGIAALVLGLISLPFILVWGVKAGHVGVKTSFREVSDDSLPAGGPYFVKPWVSVANISIQTRKLDAPATVPTKGGLAVSMHTIMLYRLEESSVPRIMREVGDKYEEVIIDTKFRNATRDVCADFAPEALYTSERTTVEAKVLARLQAELGPRGIIVEQVMLQDPDMPASVKERIQAKVGAEQDVQRMEYVLRQKKLEADAKVIEAEGIAKAQSIVKKDLDENYLRYLWIEALKESAKHNNATIYIPTGWDGMPLMKGVHAGPDRPSK